MYSYIKIYNNILYDYMKLFNGTQYEKTELIHKSYKIICFNNLQQLRRLKFVVSDVTNC